ncbi:MAG: hypothetical protein ABSG41_27335 [Bryobacteraceae bacterium]|jgi:antitoxin (DNA-binding transcriptional repressor) of toxin-antitoxin stability system
MRKASVRDLHIHTSELIREAAEGSVIIIELRRKGVVREHGNDNNEHRG